jgi:uncharacterized protein
MDTEQNRRIISHIMEELAKGNGAPFVEAMADDMIHREMGVGNWSAVRRGKQAILETLYVPLRRRYDGPATNTATHIFADGDHVIVEALGSATLKSGASYNSRHCFVIRMANGKIAEFREYLDTALADDVLGTPPA